MLNIAICDDDIQITGKIERLLQDIAKRNFVDTEIEVFWNGKSLADAIAAGERYDVIYLDIEMDKEDSYKGKLLKTRDNRLKSTKSDAENHGVGLASVYRAVAKYHGSVVIEDSEPGKFKIRIVLYSNVQE